MFRGVLFQRTGLHSFRLNENTSSNSDKFIYKDKPDKIKIEVYWIVDKGAMIYINKKDLKTYLDNGYEMASEN